MTLNKTTNSGPLATRLLPNAPGQYGTYFFATDLGRYYYSDGEKWIEKNIDAMYASPETETVIVCGVGADNAINPVRTDIEGNLMVSGTPKAASFTNLNPTGALTPAGVSLQIVAANPERQYFFFQNPSDISMFISIGDAKGSNGIVIGAGGGGIAWENFVPTNAIHVFCSAAKRYVAYEA
jgi:hypothetical protein